MDVASGEYGDVLPQLVSGIENGRLTYRGSLASSRSTRSINLEGDALYNKCMNGWLYLTGSILK